MRKNKTFKRALSILLCAVTLFVSAPLAGLVGLDLPSITDMFAPKAEAATSYTEGYYTYTITDGKAEITEVDKSISGDVTIPSTLGGYPVTSIGDSAFRNCTSLTSVTIGNSVTSIGGLAFAECKSLESITIPDTVTSIGDEAFAACTSLESITIPDGVTSIGSSVFYYCTSLTSITIPDSVTSIGYFAFTGCESLESITIPDSVTSIGYVAFGGCTSLEGITVDSNSKSYSNDECGVLFNKDKTELIQYLIGDSRTSYTIPEGVTSIGMGAFAYCVFLENVTIPDGVTSMGEAAFEGCESLKSVTIGNGVTSIDSHAFAYCNALESITIPDSVTSIGSSAFYNCTSLTDVYYGGTKEEWEKISFGEDNDYLNTATIHFKENSVINSGIISFSAPQETVVRGECVPITVVTSQNIDILKFKSVKADGSETNVYYTATMEDEKLQVSDENGIRTWNVKLRMSYSTNDEYQMQSWSLIYHDSDNYEWKESGNDFEVRVEKKKDKSPVEGVAPYSVISLDVPATVQKGTYSEITIVTTNDCARVRVNVNGKSSTYLSTSKNVTTTDNGDGTKTWKLSYKFTKVGENTVTAQARGKAWCDELAADNKVSVNK